MASTIVRKAVPMLALALLGWGLTLELSSSRARDDAKQAWPTELMAQLDKVVLFNGMDNPKTTLLDVIDHVQKRFEVVVEINTKAFEREEWKDVAKYEIAAQRPIPEMKTTLAKVLRMILGRIPVPSGAIYVIRNHVIEITTKAAMCKELGRADEESLLPLIFASYEKQSLEEALQQLAEQSDYNILLDARAGEKARGVLSAKFKNVPVDTAVRLLADMAGLEPVFQDNVLYVTTRENAARLAKEQLQRKARLPGKSRPRPLPPMP